MPWLQNTFWLISWGWGKTKPKKPNQPQKKKIKKRNVLESNLFLCVYTHQGRQARTHGPVHGCVHNFVLINLTHFKGIFMGPKRLSRKTLNYWSKFKKSLLEEQKRLVKHCLCAVTMHFPRAIWKPKQLKILFFHLKGPSRTKGAVLGFAFRPQMWQAGENT